MECYEGMNLPEDETQLTKAQKASQIARSKKIKSSYPNLLST